MICHCAVYMFVASASHAVALKAWGQKKRLFISFSLINEANEKKSLFRKNQILWRLSRKRKKSLGWKFARYGPDFNTETKNLESHVKTYSCELYVCVCEKKFEFREVSHTHGIFQLLLLKLLLRFFKRGKLVKKILLKKVKLLTRVLLLLWRTRRSML